MFQIPTFQEAGPGTKMSKNVAKTEVKTLGGFRVQPWGANIWGCFFQHVGYRIPMICVLWLIVIICIWGAYAEWAHMFFFNAFSVTSSRQFKRLTIMFCDAIWYESTLILFVNTWIMCWIQQCTVLRVSRFHMLSTNFTNPACFARSPAPGFFRGDGTLCQR